MQDINKPYQLKCQISSTKLNSFTHNHSFKCLFSIYYVPGYKPGDGKTRDKRHPIFKISTKVEMSTNYIVITYLSTKVIHNGLVKLDQLQGVRKSFLKVMLISSLKKKKQFFGDKEGMCIPGRITYANDTEINAGLPSICNSKVAEFHNM